MSRINSKVKHNTIKYSKKLLAIMDFLNYNKNKSPAIKRKVGAIVINKNGIIVDGHNYSCAQQSCENTNNETFNTVIHAEENAIMYALKNGLSLDDGEIYCTYSPCYTCSRLIIQSGITKLFFIDEHPKNFREPEIKDDTSTLDMLKHNGVDVYKIILDEEKNQHKIEKL